jgi:hypothetical protein
MPIESEYEEQNAKAEHGAPRGRRRRVISGGGVNPIVQKLIDDNSLSDEALAAESALQRPPESEPESDPSPEPDSAVDAVSEESLSPELRRLLIPNPESEPRAPSRAERREVRQADRDARNKVAPSMKKLGELGKKMPGPEHAKVHKRLENGTLAYVGEYGVKDIAQSQDLETFLHRYVKPHFGPGEYQIRGVDARGNEYDAGTITLLGSKEKEDASTNELSPLSLLQRQLDRDAEERRRERTQQRAPEKDPIDQFVKLTELGDKLNKGDGGALSTVLQGVLQTVQRSEDRMMAMIGDMQNKKSEPDPLMLMLLNKLFDDKKSDAGVAGLPPMPPPPDPVLQLKALAETMALLQPKRDEDSVLIKYLLSRPDDRLTTKDLLELLDKRGGGTSTPDDFKKTVENIGAFMQLAKTINGDGGTSSVVADVVSALANSRLPDSLANLIRSRATKQLPPPSDNNNERERMLGALRAAEQRVAQLEQRLRQVLQPQPQPTAQVVDGVPVPAALEAPAVTEAPVVAVGAPATTAAAPTAAPVSLPPKIGDYVNEIVSAKDDAALVQAMVELVYYLTEPEAGLLKRYGDLIVGLIKAGNKDKTLEYVKALFDGLRGLGLVDQTLCDRVLPALAAHFEDVVQFANAPEEPEDDDEEDGPELPPQSPHPGD